MVYDYQKFMDSPLIRMNDTPQGDGNACLLVFISLVIISNKNEWYSARRRKPYNRLYTWCKFKKQKIRMNDTPQGDGNVSINSFFKAKSNIIRMNDTP